jgi:hypothetical protein
MLYALLDGTARSSTELAIIADVSPTTASVHLERLMTERLITVVAQGKHRFYRLRGPAVARVLECLDVVAGSRATRATGTPHELRTARTCYDHMAGTIAVSLHDRMLALGWLSSQDDASYEVTAPGEEALGIVGIDVARARSMRRRFAYGCIDWSERRPHIAGALGAALLDVFLRKGWVTPESDSRALVVTNRGREALNVRFGVSAAMTEANYAPGSETTTLLAETPLR